MTTTPDTYLEWGRFDASGKLNIEGWGRVDAIDVSLIPAGRAIYRCAGILKRGTKRANENVEKVAVLTIDDVGTRIDRAMMEAGAAMGFIPQPTDILETSPGNFQWQYVLKGGMDPVDYVALRAVMKAHPIYGHSHTTAPSSLIRVPMGVNGKPGKASWKVVRVGGSGLEVEPGVFGVAGASIPKIVPSDLRAPSDALVEAALLGLPNDGTSLYSDTRAAWIKFGHALYGATGGTRWDLWEGWCNQQPQGEDIEAVWDSFFGTTTGWPTLHWLVRNHGNPGALAGALFDDGEVTAPPPVSGTPNPKQLRYATAIAALYGSAMRYNLDRKAWAEFDGSIWRPLPSGVKLAARHSIEIAKHAPPKSKGDHDIQTASFHDGVESLARQLKELQARETDFDKDVWLLGTPKGTVDLKTGTFIAARAGDMISKATAVVPMTGCARWLKFIDEITMGDPESKLFLQQWAGYCLTGSTREQKFLFLHGPGGNGKSVFVDTLMAVMADYAVKPVGDLFVKKAHGVGHTSKLAMLSGARLCTVSEVPAGAQWDEGLLKDVTGGGQLTAGFKHKDEFTFEPRFKLTALGNHKPTFPGGINPAIRRRFLMMEFAYRPKVVDADLMDKLRQEWSGILKWCIEGCRSWLASGLMIPGKVTVSTDAFFDEEDTFGQWVAARLEVKRGAVEGATDLFNDWLEWRAKQGGSADPQNPTTFGREMNERGFVKVKAKTRNEYQDIKLRSKAVDAFDREN